MRPRFVLALALLATLAVAGCADDEEDGARRQAAERTQTEPSPSAQREALEDTSRKPDIPKPSGSPPRRLVKEEIVRGKGRAAKPGDLVTVNYAGVTFSTGQEFDASWNSGQPYRFKLGAGEPIEGWDMGVAGMKEGGRRMVTIPPEQAYGSQGSPPKIGPNETLVIVFDLLRVR